MVEYTYKYPRPAVTADCIVITRDREVLLIKRANEPFKGAWAFPGGFLEMDETTSDCAIRELKEETGLEVEDVYQVGTYDAVNRDPRGRTISVAYVCVIDNAEEVTAADDAAKAQWWSLDSLPELAFDHEQILEDAQEIAQMMIEDI